MGVGKEGWEGVGERGDPLLQFGTLRRQEVRTSARPFSPHLPHFMSPELSLLVSHALAQTGWRTWEFSVALILSDLYPSSLLLVAGYGLLDDLVQVLSGPALGRYIDRTERYSAATRMYAVQHILVAVSCGAAIGAYLTLPGSALRAGLATAVLATGALAGVGASGSSLSVEQDWVVALCGEDSQTLSRLNSAMRAVDLSCLLLAPLVASLLLQYAGTWVALLVFAGYNAVAFFPENLLLKQAQASSLALQAPRKDKEEEGGSPTSSASTATALPPSLTAGLCDSTITPLLLYARQRVVVVMLALALLYFTVLSMGYLMTAYLHSQGTSDVLISLFRGGGAVMGLSSTFLFPALARTLGLPALASAAVTFQLACLVAGAAPLSLGFLSPLPTQLLVLQGGVAASRLGLWMADLAINQMIQESVKSSELGAVQGVQRSVCALFEMMSYAGGLVWDHPSQFPLLMYGSVAAVSASALLCLYFAVVWRGALRPTASSSNPSGEEGSSGNEPLLGGGLTDDSGEAGLLGIQG